MDNSAEHEAAESDMDHRLRDVEAIDSSRHTSIVSIRVLPETPRARHMGKSALQILRGMAPRI